MKAKIFYLTMTLVMVLSLVVVPAAVAEEVDPPYAYDPASDSLELYAGGNDSLDLNISIPWGGVKKTREVRTGMVVKPINPAVPADSLTFSFTPAILYVGISGNTTTVTVSAEAGADIGNYTYKIVADDLDNGEGPAIGEADGCHIYITVSEAPTLYTLTMQVSGCGTTTPDVGDHTYAPGTEVGISATPCGGWEFVSWTGDVAGPSSPTTTVTMDSDKTVSANFAEIPAECTEWTPEGNNVVACSGDGVFEFVEVTADGTTTAIPIGENPGGTLPANFNVVGQFWDVETTASYTGPVTVGFSYDPSEVENEEDVKLFHWTGTEWNDVTTYVYTDTNMVYGQVKSLSPFFVGEPVGEAGTGAPAAGCFIATAAYGTPTAEEIDVLRAFRDQVLMESSLGSQFVAWYYDFSPPLAEFISEHSLLRALVRELVIEPMVSLAELTQGIWGD